MIAIVTTSTVFKSQQRTYTENKKNIIAEVWFGSPNSHFYFLCVLFFGLYHCLIKQPQISPIYGLN